MKSKTKISKAAELLRNALRALSGKASVLRVRLHFLASLRRRTAMVDAASRHLRAHIMPGRQRDAVDDHRKALAPALAVEERAGVAAWCPTVDAAGLSELLQEVVGDDDDEGGGYPDWTHSLFDDDDLHDGDVDEDEERSGGGETAEGDCLAVDEPSVMDVITRRREGDGVEFNVEEEIDQAADMFIRRVRSRMNN